MGRCTKVGCSRSHKPSDCREYVEKISAFLKTSPYSKLNPDFNPNYGADRRVSTALEPLEKRKFHGADSNALTLIEDAMSLLSIHGVTMPPMHCLGVYLRL
jgi:hypothetical protein